MSTRLEKRDVSESLAGIGVACLVALVTLALAGMMRLTLERLSIGEAAALATSLVSTIIAAKGPARLAAGAAIGATLSLGVIVALGCAWSLAQPLVVTRARCGTGDIGVPFLLALAGFVGAAFALPIALVGRLVPRAVLVASVAITVVGVATAALGLRSLTKPEPDSYLQLFDEVPIEPGTSAAVAGKAIAYDAAPRPASLLGERKCTLVVGEDHFAIDAFEACPSLVMAHDPIANRDVIIQKPVDDPVAIAGAVTGVAPDVLGVADFRGRLGAPRAWVLGALVGLGFAAAALAMALRFRRQAREAAAAVETTHTGGGWITVFGAPRFVSGLASRAPGPVLVLAHGATRWPTYRDDGVAKIFKVTPGNRATLRAEAHARMAAWALVAIASIVTTSAPLWVSRLFGIL